jgi:hypothetical protein
MKKNYVPDWKLERYQLGELPEDELKNIAALAREDERLRERPAALRASDAEILAKYPPARMAANIKQAYAGESGFAGKPTVSVDKPRAGRWSGGNFSRWAIPAFACAALLVVLPLRMINTGTANDNAGLYDNDNGIRAKGVATGIEVWRKDGESAEKLTPKAVARTGDIVQLRYIVPEFCYGALVSVDGRGVMTVHLSGDSGKAAPLTPGRPVALDNSYQLDDAPLFEAFYLITAPEKFDIDSVAQLLKNANHPIDGKRGLSLPKKQRVTTFTLNK